MEWIRNAVSTAMLAGCLLASLGNESWALSEGRGAGGEPYITGGVGDDEREILNKRRQDFNLSITTVVKRSGAYLASARVSVTDPASRQVLSTTLDGPWMFIRLAPGRYTVEALVDEQRQQQTVVIGATGYRELYFYFDVAAEVLPEAEAKENVTKGKR